MCLRIRRITLFWTLVSVVLARFGNFNVPKIECGVTLRSDWLHVMTFNRDRQRLSSPRHFDSSVRLALK
jgi:hypothetical protein